jgi:hypothetical protein
MCPVYRACLCAALPYPGITRYLRYYDGIRLPRRRLASSVCCVVGHTPPAWRAARVSRVAAHTLYVMLGSPTPGRHPRTHLSARACVAFRHLNTVSPPVFVSFRGSITFKPNAWLSTLKRNHCCLRSMTRYQWIGSILPGRGFHTLICATLPGRSQKSDTSKLP